MPLVLIILVDILEIIQHLHYTEATHISLRLMLKDIHFISKQQKQMDQHHSMKVIQVGM